MIKEESVELGYFNSESNYLGIDLWVYYKKDLIRLFFFFENIMRGKCKIKVLHRSFAGEINPWFKRSPLFWKEKNENNCL